MAATTQDRDTPAVLVERTMRLVLKASTKIFAGAMVAIEDATGLAVNATDTAGLTIMGRAEAQADTALGDTEIVVSRGVFVWANDGTIVRANVGELACVLDNQTVTLAATAVNDIGCGWIDDVRDDGVVVAMLGGAVKAA